MQPYHIQLIIDHLKSEFSPFCFAISPKHKMNNAIESNFLIAEYFKIGYSTAVDSWVDRCG